VADGHVRILDPPSIWRRNLYGKERSVFYALQDVSVRMERGESLAIIGGNGAGKSPLLSLVAGLCRPTEGRIAADAAWPRC